MEQTCVFVCESVLTVFCALETEREGNHDPSWSAAIFFQCLNFFQNCLKCCFCTASSLSRLYLVTVRACCDLMPECRLLWILYAEATVHVVISGLSESCIKLWLDWTGLSLTKRCLFCVSRFEYRKTWGVLNNVCYFLQVHNTQNYNHKLAFTMVQQSSHVGSPHQCTWSLIE